MSQGTRYTWKQPVGGKTIVWRPLTGGDMMDLDTNYSRADMQPLRIYAQYAMRIVSCEGVAEKFQAHDFRSWDEIDINAFGQEVDGKESMRLAAVRGQADDDAFRRLERVAEAAHSAIKNLAAEMQLLLQTVRGVEAKTGPLKASGSPSV